MNTFQIDLERGKEVELKVLKIIQKKFKSATMIDMFKGYDIWIPEENYGVEVKYDPMSNATGNYCIEIEYHNKPSALLTTTAKFWVIYDDNKFLLIKPMKIIECIFMNKLEYKEFVATGDSISKKLFLVKKETLAKYGKFMKGN